MKYEYMAVPFVGKLRRGLFNVVEDAGEVSRQLTALMNLYANQGWEFCAMNDVDIEVKPGCLAGIFGARTAFFPLDQVIFRRPAGELPPPLA